jgi:hypothetical protein
MIGATHVMVPGPCGNPPTLLPVYEYVSPSWSTPLIVVPSAMSQSIVDVHIRVSATFTMAALKPARRAVSAMQSTRLHKRCQLGEFGDGKRPPAAVKAESETGQVVVAGVMRVKWSWIAPTDLGEGRIVGVQHQGIFKISIAILGHLSNDSTNIACRSYSSRPTAMGNS